MKIQEIQRTASTTSDKWESDKTIQNVSGLKMIPDSEQYGYKLQNFEDSDRLNLTGTSLVVNFYDTKAPDGILYIGFISFRQVDFPPFKKAVQVSNALLDNRYRGKGIGILMYTTIMKLGYTIIADETQTPQARKLWVNLNQTTGVEVRGRIEISRSDIDIENAYEDWKKEKIKANLRKLKSIGAVMIGNLNDYEFNDYVPLDFKVQRNKTGSELMTRGIKLYSNKNFEDIEEDYYVNLYARWID